MWSTRNVPAQVEHSPARVVQGDGFALSVPEIWQNQTVYVLAGPAADGFQHNVTVSVDPEAGVASLKAYATRQTQALCSALPDLHLLRRDAMTLYDGRPAQRTIFRWYPTAGRLLYQQHLYVLAGGTGYTLAASFTPNTRKALGPVVEHIMRSFAAAADVPPAA